MKPTRVLLLCALTLAGLLVDTAATAQPPTRLVAFGDSLTAGLRDTNVDCEDPATFRGYPPRLRNLLAAEGFDVEIDVQAVCGETTFEGLVRIDELLPALEADAADLVLLMEGTNDLSRGNPAIGFETVADNLRMMAAKITDTGTTPIYSSIVPYGPTVDVQDRNLRAGKLADALATTAEIQGVPFADPFNDLLAVDDLFEEHYDEDDFHLDTSGYALLAESFVDPVLDGLAGACVPGVPCDETGPTLCLGDDRFRIDVDWRTADDEGQGMGAPLTSETGRFWFFGPDNLELLVKMLDGRCINEHFWLFYGALSNVEFTIRVTDTETCRRQVYFNPGGTFASVGDTAALPDAPDPGQCGAE